MTSEAVKQVQLRPGIDHIGVGVGAFVFDDDGRVLLVKRSDTSRTAPGTWSRPGGAVEYGEHCEVALAREIEEETGLRICSPSVLDVSSDLSAGGPHWVSIGYVAKLSPGCRPSDAVNREPHKHSALGWFALDALPAPLANFTQAGIDKLAAQEDAVGESGCKRRKQEP
mmetsp:Transcript_33331/g.75996  ORF Transcript_33331/g.75996 Transcript_33331/m.75996 type:complete len:169 (+) Transcript_33331:56-562(+)|eukprot:3541144-Amphidinium_carterae.1